MTCTSINGSAYFIPSSEILTKTKNEKTMKEAEKFIKVKEDILKNCLIAMNKIRHTSISDHL